MSERSRGLEDLLDDAQDAAQDASSSGGTADGQWVKETIELLDQRGLLEPILFGPDQAPPPGAEQPDQGGSGEESAPGSPDLDARTIEEAGYAIMDQLGEDVKVAEVVEICENNPQMVNQQLEEHL